MNGKASKLYNWGLPKLKNELRMLQKKNWSKHISFCSNNVLQPQQHLIIMAIKEQLNSIPNDQHVVRNSPTFEAIRDCLNKN